MRRWFLKAAVKFQETNWSKFLFRFGMLLIIFLFLARILGIDTIKLVPVF